MTAAHSAGLLLHRQAREPEVLLAHMGGPYWRGREEGAWSIPKGEFDPDVETAEGAAVREFREELGIDPPPGPYRDLGVFRYRSGKQLRVFAADGAGIPLADAVFGQFDLEWPPRSGRIARFPEVDRVSWVPLARARTLLVPGQRPALDALAEA